LTAARSCGAITLAAALVLLWGGAALAQCKAPRPVRSYLRAHRAWSVVEERDLDRSDRLAWRRARHGACPGIATIDLGGRGHRSYAMALTRKNRGQRLEQLVLLEAAGRHRLATKNLVASFRIGSPLVVWRSHARSVRAFGSQGRIAIPHDSIVFEKIGLSSKIFYLDGKIRTALVAE
jgi:hypothetical protein